MNLDHMLIASILDLRSQCKGKKVTIIGDIHGCYDELDQLLDTIDWSPSSHILILTGDLIDRGPKIKETLMFAMNTPSVYSLMSNHEQKLLRYLQAVRCGLLVLLRQYNNAERAFSNIHHF